MKDTSNSVKSPWGSSDVSHGLRFFYPLVRVGGVGIENDRISLVHYDGGYNYHLATPEGSFADDNSDHLVVFQSDGSTITAYINGASVVLSVIGGVNNGHWFGDLTGIDLFTIGELWYNVTTHASNWGGEIDEFRISADTRSAAWRKAEYETGRDNLLDFGAEESVPTGGASSSHLACQAAMTFIIEVDD